MSERRADRRARAQSFCQEIKWKIWTDHKEFYDRDGARDLLLGIAAASVLANTSLDQDFQDWYQDDVHSSGTEDLAQAWDAIGDGRIFIPVLAGAGVLAEICGHTPCAGVLGDFGCRTGRAYLVGAPPVVFLQYGLGASRPGLSDQESRWKPFDDGNSVSGHAFVGAVPFITAAKMTENPGLKGALYLCSALPAWARVDEDAHYLSQAFLGWWIAYLACEAINDTEYEFKHLTLTPVTTPEMAGIGLIYRR